MFTGILYRFEPFKQTNFEITMEDHELKKETQHTWKSKHRKLLRLLCSWELNYLYETAPYEIAPLLPLPIDPSVFERIIEQTEGIIAYHMPSKRLREWCIRYAIECIKVRRISLSSLTHHVKWMVYEEAWSMFHSDLYELVHCSNPSKGLPHDVVSAFNDCVYERNQRRIIEPVFQRVFEVARASYVLAQENVDVLSDSIGWKLKEAMEDPKMDHFFKWGFGLRGSGDAFPPAYTDDELVSNLRTLSANLSLRSEDAYFYYCIALARAQPAVEMMYRFGFPPNPLQACHGFLSDMWDTEGGVVFCNIITNPLETTNE